MAESELESGPRPRSRRWWGLGAGLVIIAVGAAALLGDEGTNFGTVPGHETTSAVASPGDQLGENSTVRRASAEKEPGPDSSDTGALSPTRVVVPSLDVDAQVQPRAVDEEGALGVPSDPRELGWWAAGPRPGGPKGTSIIAGHVNYKGAQGAFAQLTDVGAGDEVVIYEGKRSRTFEIVAVRTWAKGSLADNNAFDPESPGRVALVTCTGDIDPETGHYDDNVIAYAVPV